MRPASIILSSLAAGIVLACAPGPVMAGDLTDERCEKHAAFAYGVLSDEIGRGVLTEFVKANLEELPFFARIMELAPIAKAAGVPAVKFGNDILEACTAAVKGGTV